MTSRTLTADTEALASATADAAATVRLIQSSAAKKQALAANVVTLLQAANNAAILTAIGAVAKAGDSMTGGLTISLAGAALTLVGDGNDPEVTQSRYSGNAGGASYNMRKARGSLAVPAAVNNTDTVLSLVGRAYDGSNFIQVGALNVVMNQATPGVGAMGTILNLRATPVGSATSATVATVTGGGGLSMVGATSGDRGTGTINATAVYDDNVLLTCYIFDAALDGKVSLDKWDAKVPDREFPAEFDEVEDKSAEPDGDGLRPRKRVETAPARTEARTHFGARKFIGRLGGKHDPLDIDKYADHWKTKRHLTSMPNEERFDPIGGALSTGEWLQRLIETVEIQAVHIDHLNQRLKSIEAGI